MNMVEAMKSMLEGNMVRGDDGIVYDISDGKLWCLDLYDKGGEWERCQNLRENDYILYKEEISVCELFNRMDRADMFSSVAELMVMWNNRLKFETNEAWLSCASKDEGNYVAEIRELL